MVRRSRLYGHTSTMSAICMSLNVPSSGSCACTAASAMVSPPGCGRASGRIALAKREQVRIDAVGLGQNAERLGKLTRLARVDNGNV